MGVYLQQMNRNDGGVWRFYGSSILGVVVLTEGYREKPFSVILLKIVGLGRFRVFVPSSNYVTSLLNHESVDSLTWVFFKEIYLLKIKFF